MVESMDGALHGFKAKYVFMDMLFKNALDKVESGKAKYDTVNIFINFESIFNAIRTGKLNKQLAELNKKELAFIGRQMIAGILNVAAHYRLYFYRHRIKTNIVYYYNEIPEEEETNYNNTPLCPDYRYHYFESMNYSEKVHTCNVLIKDIIPSIRVITEYLENVYFVSSNHLESSVIPYAFMMNNELPSNLNIFVTKDEYDLQYCIYNGLVITRADGEAVLITKRNLIKYLNVKYNLSNPPMEINMRLFPFIKSCIGDRKRSLSNVQGFGYKTTYRNILKLYDTGYLLDESPETFNIQNLIHVLNTYSFKQEDDSGLASQIMRNFKCIDLESQYKIMTDTQYKKLTKQLTDKTDTSALIDLNNRYFDNTPLQIMELNQYNEREAKKNLVFSL